MAKSLKKVSHLVLPHLGAVGGFADGLIQGQGIGGALKGGLRGGLEAAGSIVGGNIGGSILPSTFGSVLGKSAGNALGSTIANTSLGQTLGSFAGNAYGNSLSDTILGQQTPKNTNAPRVAAAPEAAPFEPKQEAQLQLPNSLSGLSGFDQNQQSSNIATQGVYGGGNGQQEQDYFTNLINRRLVDESGQVDQNFNDINPIENSYLSQLGFGGYSNPSSLLEALNGRKQAAYA